MSGFSLNASGIEKLNGRLAALIPKIKKAVKTELFAFANEVKEASQMVVPVDTGNLKNSCHVEMHPEIPMGGSPAFTFDPAQTPRSEDEVVVTVGYGGAARDYAVHVHENLGQVNWKRPGAQPKFLEGALKDRQDVLPGRIRSAVEAAIK